MVKLEEKRRIFWFRIDNFSIFARAPIMTVILIGVTFTGNVSYANTGKAFDIHRQSPVIERKINEIKEGDYLVFYNAGAYGFEMSSNFNSRLKPAEVLVKDGKAILIRKRDSFQDL